MDEQAKYKVKQITLKPGASASHETRTGSTVILSSDSYTEMSEDEARTFLIDPTAFDVLDEKDRPVLAPSLKDPSKGQFTLDQDEVVAKLHELTQEALWNRCLRLPNHDGISKGSKKDVMIKALLNKPKDIGFGRGSEFAAAEMNDLEGIPLKSTEDMLANVAVLG